MNLLLRYTSFIVSLGLGHASLACENCSTPVPEDPALSIESASVTRLLDLDLLVFEVNLKGAAGSVTPEPKGMLDGAPVLGYVFPTTLEPEAVGFGEVEGILALAATSHPDFDDTPLWDEDSDGDYGNDGVIWHTHWVVLAEDSRIEALAVKQFEKGDDSVVLPPTNPGMPMYMDSPGYAVMTKDNRLRIVVPEYRIRSDESFRFDAVTAFMRVNTSDPDRPMLGVYKVYSVASGDLSLPYEVANDTRGLN
ncbi:hypothetical protein [Pelagicoccus sp. SDUM812003]|uniref:hypothetical protein n=1 Tax=Pelagicoccus sp. SDUM812003 TaxID=3041267 RepID=UPI0028107E27|nr:hypothetical protein [Pelagicoccus sp. SDUM812003]MDQ8205623.1 hypothetical protein [Pelagicoccus sp. SDUM812003]